MPISHQCISHAANSAFRRTPWISPFSLQRLLHSSQARRATLSPTKWYTNPGIIAVELPDPRETPVPRRGVKHFCSLESFLSTRPGGGARKRQTECSTRAADYSRSTTERSSDTRERSPRRYETSAARAEHSAGHAERSRWLVEHSAVLRQRSLSFPEHSLLFRQHSAAFPEHSAALHEHSAQHDEHSAPQDEHSAAGRSRPQRGAATATAPRMNSAMSFFSLSWSAGRMYIMWPAS